MTLILKTPFQLEDQYAINLNFFNDADFDPNVEGWSLKDREEDYADYFKSLIQQFKRFKHAFMLGILKQNLI